MAHASATVRSLGSVRKQWIAGFLLALGNEIRSLRISRVSVSVTKCEQSL